MKLYFKNSCGERCLIGEPEIRTEVNKMVYDFCKAHDFHIYYVRNWIENGELWWNVGSHFEFFIASPYEGEL